MWWFSKKKNEFNPNAMKKDELIMNILSLEGSIPLTIEKGQDTDIVITNELLNKKWDTCKKRITYTARILLNDDEKTNN